jgi:hypothetical protein
MTFFFIAVVLKLSSVSESPEELVKIQIVGPCPEFLIQKVCPKFAFLMSSKEMLTSWVQGPPSSTFMNKS